MYIELLKDLGIIVLTLGFLAGILWFSAKFDDRTDEARRQTGSANAGLLISVSYAAAVTLAGLAVASVKDLSTGLYVLLALLAVPLVWAFVGIIHWADRQDAKLTPDQQDALLRAASDPYVTRLGA